MTSSNEAFQDRAINTIRFLAADAVQQAKSGHPGLPMGAAAMAYALWTRHLRFNPSDPHWPNRDRFVLSGGHGSMLLYALLYLTGFGLSLEDLKQFRQWGSPTPGHPERDMSYGIEVTTGPLGQGFGNAVGMAVAESHLAAIFNRADHRVVAHHIYAIVTDGDLMEGVSSEAASLAGHLKLGKLIFLYDDNRISIDGSTELSFTEDRGARFLAYGWQVLHVQDGNDVDAIDEAIGQARQDPRPSLIVCRTQIGYGAPQKQGTAKAHGEPLGEDELEAAKQNLNWPLEPRFFVPQDVLNFYRKAISRGQQWQDDWETALAAYQADYPDLATELERRLSGLLPAGWEKDLPVFPSDPKGMATRAASGRVINVLGKRIPELIGGSADLTPSNKTWIDGNEPYQAENPSGKYFHFGVREHAMGALINGMAVYGGVVPYGGTFLVFSDYMRASIRLSAMSNAPSIWVFTHDSVGVGEDGPTHQPVEHLAGLRVIPGLRVIRPGDANEVVEAWRAAIEHRRGPTALILSRQAMPTLDRSIYAPASGLRMGAYQLADIGEKRPELVLMASGSELNLIVRAGELLGAEGVNVRLISFPSWELFQEQEEDYCDQLILPDVPARIAVEAGVGQGWERYVGDEGAIISLEGYGASAPAAINLEKFGFTVDNVIRTAEKLLR